MSCAKQFKEKSTSISFKIFFIAIKNGFVGQYNNCLTKPSVNRVDFYFALSEISRYNFFEAFFVFFEGYFSFTD